MTDLLPWGMTLALFIGAGALLWLMRKDNAAKGELDAKNKSLQVMVDNVKKANDARNDPVTLARVREKYSRD